MNPVVKCNGYAFFLDKQITQNRYSSEHIVHRNNEDYPWAKKNMSPRFVFTNQNNMDKVVKHGKTMSMFIYLLPITISNHHGCSFINLNCMYMQLWWCNQSTLFTRTFFCTTIRATILSILLIFYKRQFRLSYDNVQNIKLRSNYRQWPFH